MSLWQYVITSKYLHLKMRVSSLKTLLGLAGKSLPCGKEGLAQTVRNLKKEQEKEVRSEFKAAARAALHKKRARTDP